jgi:hypothetical protein
MRTLVMAGILVLLAVGVVGTVAFAEEHEEIPPHGHMLIHRPVVGIVTDSEGNTGFGVESVRKCVDLAGNNVVPLHAHHEKLHFGKTGEKLFEKAGHVVVPTTPFGPWDDCADFEASLPFVFPDFD